MTEKPVGYRSPPAWTRFKPGVSGNPKGRPPKQKPEVAGVIREFLDAPTEYRENGRVKTASRVELLCRVLIEGAIKGGVPAAERLVRLRMGARRFGNVGDKEGDRGSQDREVETPIILALPWAATNHRPDKGVVHGPAASSGAIRAPLSGQMMVCASARGQLTPYARDALLLAIAKARRWVDDLASGRAASFAEIAARENKVERHIRFLAPLAFVSPRIVSAIAAGEARDDLTISALAKALPPLWVEQETTFSAPSDR